MSAERMRQHIAQFAALVNRPRCRHAHATGAAARRRELPKRPSQARDVLAHDRTHLRVGPLEIYVRDDRRTAMPRPREVDDIRVPLGDEPAEVDIDQAKTR